MHLNFHHHHSSESSLVYGSNNIGGPRLHHHRSHREHSQRLEPDFVKRLRRPVGMVPRSASAQEHIDPHENDVLLGRGGKNNRHSGNEKLRQLARGHCMNYCQATKKEKSRLARFLVTEMRKLEPPARFLRKHRGSEMWEEAREETAREKASQVLRDAVALHQQGGGEVQTPITTSPSSSAEAAASATQSTAYAETPTSSVARRTPAKKSTRHYTAAADESYRKRPRRYSTRSSTTVDSYSDFAPRTTTTHAAGISPVVSSAISPSPRGSRRLSLGASGNTGTSMNEFDLLRSELLESDIEDEDTKVPPPPDSHHDVF